MKHNLNHSVSVLVLYSLQGLLAFCRNIRTSFWFSFPFPFRMASSACKFSRCFAFNSRKFLGCSGFSIYICIYTHAFLHVLLSFSYLSGGLFLTPLFFCFGFLFLPGLSRNCIPFLLSSMIPENMAAKSFKFSWSGVGCWRLLHFCVLPVNQCLLKFSLISLIFSITKDWISTMRCWLRTSRYPGLQF